MCFPQAGGLDSFRLPDSAKVKQWIRSLQSKQQIHTWIHPASGPGIDPLLQFFWKYKSHCLDPLLMQGAPKKNIKRLDLGGVSPQVHAREQQSRVSRLSPAHVASQLVLVQVLRVQQPEAVQGKMCSHKSLGPPIQKEADSGILKNIIWTSSSKKVAQLCFLGWS